MFKKVVIIFALIFNLAACASFNGRGADRFCFKDNSSNGEHSGNNSLAIPFMATGALMVGAGGITLTVAGSQYSDVETQSEADKNGAIGLGLLAGGALLWCIGHHLHD